MLIATQPIEGSAVALGEVPLGFEPVNDRWQLCGQASFNTAGEELLLVLPEGGKLNMAAEGEEAIFSDMAPAFSLHTVKVQGKAQFQVESDELYRIRTGHAVGMGLGLELAGTQIDWPTKPALTFVGLPRVQWPTAAGELQQQGGDLYVAGKQPGSGLLQEVLGTQYVSVRNRSGNALLRRRVGILPTDFRVELRSGEKPGQGSILVHSRQRCLLQIVDDSLQVQQVKREDHTELRLSAKGFPPVRVRLSVTPSLMADPVEIDLPFPNSGFLAFDGTGKHLKRDLSVDDLLGARLY
ncbi:STY4851/ECs_5259 family protein, partial [Pseudomonas aeruginosa]